MDILSRQKVNNLSIWMYYGIICFIKMGGIVAKWKHNMGNKYGKCVKLIN